MTGKVLKLIMKVHDRIQCLLKVVSTNREMAKVELYLTILNLVSNFL